MSIEKLKIISIHSRKGGVGKTSLALSTAVQLAAQGKKTVYLDLDTLGTHLVQSWPFDQDVEKRDGKCKFIGESFGLTGAPYPRRPYFGTAFRKERLPTEKDFQDACCTLSHDALLESWDRCQELAVDPSLSHALTKVVSNLALFPGSCYLRDIDQLNGAMLHSGTQREFHRYLEAWFELFEGKNYEFVVIDHSPGLAFIPGSSLSWLLERFSPPAEDRDSNVHLWFLGGAPWWEQGLILYELNVFVRALTGFHPVLTVNRIGDCWRGDPDFHIGARIQLSSQDQAGVSPVEINAPARALSRITALPLWMGSDVNSDDLIEFVIKPSGLEMAILGEDVNHYRTMVMASDIDKVSEQSDSGWVESASDFAFKLVTQAIWAVQRDFNCLNESSQSDAHHRSAFHESVRSALVDRVIGEGT